MTTTRDTNIFYRVADSEVPFTELLCNFMSYKIFRDCFLKSILDSRFEYSDIEYDNFSTQFRLPSQCGQPDIRISNEDIEILIEIKINNTALTDNQPNKYIEYLQNVDKKTLLVFLIPQTYSQRTDLEYRFKNIPDKEYKIITWDRIIEEITGKEIENINHLFSEFFNLISSWFNPKISRFSTLEVSYMYSNSIPKILLKLFNIIDSLKKATAPTCKSSKGQTWEYGLNFKNTNGEDILYCGVWYEFWEKHNKPLIYGVHKDYPQRVKEHFENKYCNKILTLNNWKMTWFEPVDLEEPDNIIKIIQSELDEILEN